MASLMIPIPFTVRKITKCKESTRLSLSAESAKTQKSAHSMMAIRLPISQSPRAKRGKIKILVNVRNVLNGIRLPCAIKEQ